MMTALRGDVIDRVCKTNFGARGSDGSDGCNGRALVLVVCSTSSVTQQSTVCEVRLIAVKLFFFPLLCLGRRRPPPPGALSAESVTFVGVTASCLPSNGR